MKFEVTLIDDEAQLVSSVFRYLGIEEVTKQNAMIKKLILDFSEKWLYEMARKAKDARIDMDDTS